MVSDFAKDYTSFWGVPYKTEIEFREHNGRNHQINRTSIKIYDDFGQSLPTTLSVVSLPDDGASCGLDLPLGEPRLIYAYGKSQSHLNVSHCSCQPPYLALENFLRSGSDSFIPSLDMCSDDFGEISKKNECNVWQDSEYFDELMREKREAMRTQFLQDFSKQ